jgi:hypothetical protein
MSSNSDIRKLCSALIGIQNLGAGSIRTASSKGFLFLDAIYYGAFAELAKNICTL